MVFLPPGVAVRFKNPWERARLRFFGWYVWDMCQLYLIPPFSTIYQQKGFFCPPPATRVSLCDCNHISMTTTKELWENALVELELTISKPNFNTWFRDTHIVRVEDGAAALGVPSQFARDWLSTKFHKDILRSLRTLSESVRTVEYVISRGPKRNNDEAKVVPPPVSELPL